MKWEKEKMDLGSVMALLEECGRMTIHGEKWKIPGKKVKSNNDNSEITFSPYYGLRSKENTHSWIIR